MTRVFAITAANDTVRLDDKGRGDVSFTVSNTTTVPLRGIVKLKARDSTKRDWLTIAGEPERDFSPKGTHQVSVQIAVPAGTPVEKYSFRMDVLSAENPDEDYTEGPSVSFDVKAAEAAPPKKFPWWMVGAAAVLLIVLGGVTWWAMRPRMVAVPDVHGQRLTDAMNIIIGNGFNIQGVTGDPARLGEPVVSTTPGFGSMVEKGEGITINMPQPPGPPNPWPPHHIPLDVFKRQLDPSILKHIQ
jgi:hypothetical protein